MSVEKDSLNCIDYKEGYYKLRARNEVLEASYKSELDKRLEEAKENRKLKTIIAKILEEKYLKDGE